MLRSKYDLKMHVRNPRYTLPLKSGPPNTFFRRFRNLAATLTAYVFRIKHDIHNRASASETTKGLIHHLKMSWTLVHKRLKQDRRFHSPSVNSAFCFVAKGCTQPNFSKQEVNGAERRWCEPNKMALHSIEIVADVTGPQKLFTLAMASRWAAFGDNTSLSATFSSLAYFTCWNNQ